MKKNSINLIVIICIFVIINLVIYPVDTPKKIKSIEKYKVINGENIRKEIDDYLEKAFKDIEGEYKKIDELKLETENYLEKAKQDAQNARRERQLAEKERISLQEERKKAEEERIKAEEERLKAERERIKIEEEKRMFDVRKKENIIYEYNDYKMQKYINKIISRMVTNPNIIKDVIKYFEEGKIVESEAKVIVLNKLKEILKENRGKEINPKAEREYQSYLQWKTVKNNLINIIERKDFDIKKLKDAINYIKNDVDVEYKKNIENIMEEELKQLKIEKNIGEKK
ncbi:hypothetical protein [Haliovirga abyssi]|uniref:Uncharacterized protein n=1 Tax=Haliovirga abyssi TaxID=2996794 RepID=A0AAU9D5N7_9FUSO|nr:hypothetical protein [Haliovirga abyssi]BDU49863.1 hypothetical protein HLVA_04320 [Haliovirga abyssi]